MTRREFAAVVAAAAGIGAAPLGSEAGESWTVIGVIRDSLYPWSPESLSVYLSLRSTESVDRWTHMVLREQPTSEEGFWRSAMEENAAVRWSEELETWYYQTRPNTFELSGLTRSG